MEPSTARLFVWDRGVVVIRVIFRIMRTTAHTHEERWLKGGWRTGRTEKVRTECIG